jgi:2,4-dienoyl-CoA reductase-like NADH-dependent reductase (Old Yellow Enzyme family)
MSALFEPLTLRGLTLRNRVMASPMCQYSAIDGVPQEWHHVHLGGMARGGVALVMTEATSVTPKGRISPEDAGIWSDAHARAWAPIVQFLHSQGALAGMQLAHAGHKASTWRPWADEKGSVPLDHGGWQTVGPTSTGYPGLAAPRALATDELPGVVAAFASAARRALNAGFDTVEVHGAHGYLLHQFLSPLTNHRTDGYGGDLAARARLLLEVVAAVRSEWPDDRPVLVRLSATDWVEGGHDLDASVHVARWLRDLGVDLIDTSSGGISPAQAIPLAPGYQVPFAAAIRREAEIATAAVGLITSPEQAQTILEEGSADMIALARALLRDPQWPLRAAHDLGVEVTWPPQLLRAQGW